jgi:ABC-2 type transport system ATP-binding protein
MPDYFGTYPNVNCQEYLDFFARAYGLAGRERHRALRRVMDFTGLDKLAEKPIRGLSKGMKPRLCLGRAMVHNPSVLILDEPAAGLDPRARIELRNMIRQLAADGTTILVSSHILTELAEICDRVGIIECGRLLAAGTVDEIQKGQRTVRTVMVRVLDQAMAAANWLREQTGIGGVRVDGQLLYFSHDGGRSEEAQILRAMIGAGFEVAEFRSHQKSLEDVFMQVTQGAVQ